ncbi:MAG: Fe(3+) ABC transporter substrate-binding protein [Chloroflexota bacterium]|nr:Fe(3+) ABC transporter substrate-binding protein [Chloroflexota bacterium]
MKRIVRGLPFVAIAALLAAALWVPLPTLLARAQSAGEVNLYSARHYDTDQALFDGFTAETGITVNVIQAGEDQLIERLKSEGANSPADVLLTVDAGRLWRAQEAGLFQPVRSDVLEARIPANLREPEGHWFGFATRARVIAYAKDGVGPSNLSTYEALADPVWKGRLLVRSSSSVYNQSLVGSLIEANGVEATEQWARGIVENMARPPQGGDTDQLKALAAGEGDVAITNTYYYVRLLKSESPEDRAIAEQIGIFFPNQGVGERGTHVNVSGAGVAAYAPNRDNAVRFLEYLASDAAQASFASASNEYPVVEGVAIDPVLASLGTFRTDELNARTFGANNQLALLIMNAAGWR